MTIQAAKRPANHSVDPTFTTVSIPDLRVQQLSSIQEELTPQPVTTKQAAVRRNLEEIRNAIERSTVKQSQPANNVSESTQTKTTPTDARINRTGTRITNSFLTDIGNNNSQVEPIIQSIVEYYPVGGSPIIMFVGSENNPLLDITVAKTAVSIQSKTRHKVLLIDSDFDHGGLTYKMQCVRQPGLSDVVKEQANWEEAIQSTANEFIDFVSVGKTKLESSTHIDSMIKTVIPKITGSYDFVFVCGGDAHSQAATSWSSYTSGSYLLVSLTDSNQTIAKSAVSQLLAHGARLLGCIVSEVE